MSANKLIKYIVERKKVPMTSVHEMEMLNAFNEKTHALSKEYIKYIFAISPSNNISKDVMPILSRFRTKALEPGMIALSPSLNFETSFWTYLAFLDGGLPIVNKYIDDHRQYQFISYEDFTVNMYRNSFVPWFSKIYSSHILSMGSIYFVFQLNMSDTDIESLVIPSTLSENILTTETEIHKLIAQLIYSLWVLWVQGYAIELLYFTTYEHKSFMIFRMNDTLQGWLDTNQPYDLTNSQFNFKLFEGNAIQTKYSPIILPMSLARSVEQGEKFDSYISKILNNIGYTGTYTSEAFENCFSQSLESGTDVTKVKVSLRDQPSDPIMSYTDLYCILTYQGGINSSIDQNVLNKGTEQEIPYLILKWIYQFVGYDMLFVYPTIYNIYLYLIKLRDYIDQIDAITINETPKEWSLRLMKKSIDKIVPILDKNNAEKVKISYERLNKYLKYNP